MTDEQNDETMKFSTYSLLKDKMCFSNKYSSNNRKELLKAK